MPREILLVLIVAFVIIIIISLSLIIVNFKGRKYARMEQDMHVLLEKIKARDSEGISYTSPTRNKQEGIEAYDYLLETRNYRYYIKLVPNFSNDEICVNNSVRWERRKNYNDSKIRVVSNIDLLMRLDLDLKDKETKKENRKLYIIYPKAKSLLKYINECELEFIHYKTDIYGARIVTYLDLADNINLIEL